MRFAILCAVLFLASCDDETAYYADGTTWSNPMPLLKNDALRLNPTLRRYPTNAQEWTRFIQTLDAQGVNVNRSVLTSITWFGFSSDPTAPIYFADLGSIGVIWTEAQVTGTSNGTTFVLSGLPLSMRPASDVLAPTFVFDNSLAIAGYAEIESDGEIIFHRAQVSGTNIVLDASWTAAGTKGIGAGQAMFYPK